MKPQKNNSAFTMIEVMAAMLILALVCVGYSENQVAAIQLVKATRIRERAVMLAQQKMAELNFIVQNKGIEQIKDEEKGDFDSEKYDIPYTWKVWKKPVPPPDFTALLSMAGGGDEDGEDSGQQPAVAGPMKMVMDIWGKSIVELHLEVLWSEGDQEKSYSVMTHYITSDATAQVQGLIGGLMGAAGAASGGGGSSSSTTSGSGSSGTTQQVQGGGIVR